MAEERPGTLGKRAVKNSRVLVLAGIVVAVVVFFALGGQRYLTFEHVKSQQAAIDAWYAASQPVQWA